MFRFRNGNKKQLARHKAAEQVNVTMDLVDAFKPSEKQRKSALRFSNTSQSPSSRQDESTMERSKRKQALRKHGRSLRSEAPGFFSGHLAQFWEREGQNMVSEIVHVNALCLRVWNNDVEQ